MVIAAYDRSTREALDALHEWCKARATLDRARAIYLANDRSPASLKYVRTALENLDRAVDKLSLVSCR